MFVLELNDMRSSKIEHLNPVARAESKEALLAFMEVEKVEPYKDGQWGKCFKKGGWLEWYNPPYCGESIVDVGTEEIWAENAIADYKAKILPIFEIV